MTGSARAVMSHDPLLLLNGANFRNENPCPSAMPTTLHFASPQATFCSSCSSGSASRRKQPKQALDIKQRRFPRKGVTTSVDDLKCLRLDRRPAICASSLADERPSLNRNEVVELLSVGVHTLLRPENQKRLRERLEKSKQRMHQKQSIVVDQPANVDVWSSPTSINSRHDLEEVRHLEMEGDAIDSERCPSDQVSLMKVSVTIPSQTTEIVEHQGTPQSIETVESSAGTVQGREGNSLTSIRRLRVLNVHSYVHNALRESALRSWLHSRTIEE